RARTLEVVAQPREVDGEELDLVARIGVAVVPRPELRLEVGRQPDVHRILSERGKVARRGAGRADLRAAECGEILVAHIRRRRVRVAECRLDGVPDLPERANALASAVEQ